MTDEERAREIAGPCDCAGGKELPEGAFGRCSNCKSKGSILAALRDAREEQEIRYCPGCGNEVLAWNAYGERPDVDPPFDSCPTCHERVFADFGDAVRFVREEQAEEIAALRRDAARWRIARTYLDPDDVRRWGVEEASWQEHFADETDAIRAAVDAEIDMLGVPHE